MTDQQPEQTTAPAAEDGAQPTDQQPAQQMAVDPYAVAGQALEVAMRAFNYVASADPVKQRQDRARAIADFDRAVRLADAAASFGHALVAREHLQLAHRQVQQATEKRIALPGDLRV